MMVNPFTTRFRRPLIAVILAAAVALPLAGGGAAYAHSGDVPRGTTVLGIDLGGKSQADAAQALRAGLAGKLGAPLTVAVAGERATIQPADVGLTVDIDGTVDRAARSKSPLTAFFGRGQDIEPVVTVDRDRLSSALAAPAAGVTKAATAPAVRFDGVTPKAVHPTAGHGLDAQRSADAVTSGWLRQDVVDIPVVAVEPTMSNADVDRVVEEVAKPAVAAPVTVNVAGKKLTVSPQAIAKSLVLTGDPITPKVDEAKLRSALSSQLAKVESRPHDLVVGGKTLASTGGTVVDTAALARDLMPVLSSPAPRTVSASVTAVAGEAMPDELAQQGIREQMSSFTTHFTGGLSSARSQNIATIAKKVDGAVVQPGETFSLNGFTGPRGYAEGYKDAPVILNDKLVPGVGGGVSQFTTTLFNATYYAGLEDVFHQPHGYYFTRYPSVIESTIFYPDLDFKFRNDTSQAVLIDTSVTDDSVTVAIWGVKRYDISTEWSAKRDIVQPQTQRLAKGPTCIATAGSEGFTQDAWRIFRQDGKEVSREKFTWRYDAEPRFVCE
jgi:vancomycin resistance protein YoaR